jgi:hypothetical protein
VLPAQVQRSGKLRVERAGECVCVERENAYDTLFWDDVCNSLVSQESHRSASSGMTTGMHTGNCQLKGNRRCEQVFVSTMKCVYHDVSCISGAIVCELTRVQMVNLRMPRPTSKTTKTSTNAQPLPTRKGGRNRMPSSKALAQELHTAG